MLSFLFSWFLNFKIYHVLILINILLIHLFGRPFWYKNSFSSQKYFFMSDYFKIAVADL